MYKFISPIRSKFGLIIIHVGFHWCNFTLLHLLIVLKWRLWHLDICWVSALFCVVFGLGPVSLYLGTQRFWSELNLLLRSKKRKVKRKKRKLKIRTEEWQEKGEEKEKKNSLYKENCNLKRSKFALVFPKMEPKVGILVSSPRSSPFIPD